MADWQQIRLGEISQIYSGFAFRTQDFCKHGIPVVKIANIQNKRVIPKCSDHFLEELCTEKLNRYFLQANDSLIAMTGAGSVGKVGKMPRMAGRFLVNQRVAIVRPDDSRCDPAFVYFALSQDSYETKLYGLGLGAGQPNVSARQIGELEIPFPPLPLQRRISGILLAYDELIENNQQRIRILEEMARSLFREWFVYFRYPGYESAPLVDSAVGQIPQGWEVKKLGDLLSYNRHATKPGNHLDERRYVPIDCIPSKSLALLEARPIEEAQSSLQLFEKGDILFGAMRPYFHKVVVAPFAGVTRTTCFVFKPARPEWHAFATMSAFEESTVAYANAHSQGATIPYAVWDGSLAEMPLVLPPEALLRRFERAAAPMLASLSQSFFTLSNLRQTRDLLLPRLLSGQVNRL